MSRCARDRPRTLRSHPRRCTARSDRRPAPRSGHGCREGRIDTETPRSQSQAGPLRPAVCRRDPPPGKSAAHRRSPARRRIAAIRRWPGPPRCCTTRPKSPERFAGRSRSSPASHSSSRRWRVEARSDSRRCTRRRSADGRRRHRWSVDSSVEASSCTDSPGPRSAAAPTRLPSSGSTPVLVEISLHGPGGVE